MKNLQENIDRMQKELDAMKLKVKWPQKGDLYYSVVSTGGITQLLFHNGPEDKHLMLKGLVFKTEYEAELYLVTEHKDLTIRQELKELNDGWIPDWNNKLQTKYCIQWDHHFQDIDVIGRHTIQSTKYFARRDVIFVHLCNKYGAKHVARALGIL